VADPAPASDPDVFAAFMSGAKSDPQGEATVVMTALGATTPAVPALEERPETDGRPTLELPAPVPALVSASQRELPVVMGESVSVENPMPEAPDPFAGVPSRTDSGDTFRGLTSTFDALADGASPQVPHLGAPRAAGPAAGSPNVIMGDVPRAPQPPAGLLDDVVSAQSAVPTIEFQTVGANAAPLKVADVPRRPGMPLPPPPAPPRSSGSGLLADIPDEGLEPPSAVVAPRVEFNTQATEAIAREYERELREKLEASKQKKSFLQRHGLKLVAALVLLVVVGGGLGGFFVTRQRNQGETLDSALAKGLTGITADTKEQYGAAIKALDQALTMDDGNPAALATKAYAHAMLFAEHGHDDKQREAALTALSGPTRKAQPEYAVVVDYLTADAAGLGAARQQLLDSSVDKSLVHAHAGRLLLGDKKQDEALARLKKAIELDPRQTIALVALGDYYLANEDWESALEMMGRAEPLSHSHPARVLGQAQARLELGRELPEALSDLDGLPANASVPEALAGRYALLLGRARSANGKHDEAIKTLTDALATHGKTMAFDCQVALGGAYKAAGQMPNAQKAFEEAIKLNGKSEDAKAGLGRVLLARSREKELLERLKADKDQRKLALLRGIAWSKLGDSKHAREELSKTLVNGKAPPEAAVYLALADAADDSQKAIELLELVLGKTRQKSTVQVALARVHMQRNQLDKAKALLEEAAKDPQDYEGNALLGQLLLEAGVPVDIAIEPLQRAVDRNGSHAPSRHLLTRALLALGKVDAAVKGVDAWLLDNPALEQAWKDAALTYLEAGRLKDAEGAVNKVSATSDDLEFWRVKARVLFARGDGRGAMGALERANKLNPKDAATFCEIGNAFVRQGNADTALKAYEAAVREDARSVCGIAGQFHARPSPRGKPAPIAVVSALITKSNDVWEKAFLQATLSRLHLEDRDLKNALAMAEDATTAAPASAAAWFAMGEVQRRQKADDKARDAYQRAAELDGSWSAVHLALADVLAKQGGDALPRAIAEYELVMQLDQNEIEANRAKKVAAALKKQLKEP
jgi:tetratricopeptide (TPR) repeat protein